MKIIVCLKQILDPLIPVRDFRIDSEARAAVQGSASLVTNIFCENALETALQLRDRAGGHITVISYGAPTAEDSLRKALAMKADEAVLLANDGHPHPDPLAVARVLAAAIRRIGSFDLILTGRESGDWGAGQTGGLLAEELGIPCLNFVDTIEAEGGALRIKRQTDTGWERIEARPPVVLTITNDEHNVPRIPKTRDVMMSYRQPLTRWTLDDLGAGASLDAAEVRSGGGYYRVADLSIPVKETKCELVTGDTLEERVSALASRILAVTREM